MAVIFDAVAQRGFRGVFKTLLSPSGAVPDSTAKPQPRYACARKKYRSGRKGRTSVYRVVGEHSDERGRKVRHYSNVEGENLDEDERGEFAGIEKIADCSKRCSVRRKKDWMRLAGNISKKDELRAKKPAPKAQNPSEADHMRSVGRGANAPGEGHTHTPTSTS
ncbi:hypothetical protein BDW02DRAFT_474608, partial [Decorospora gaudefroyi]